MNTLTICCKKCPITKKRISKIPPEAIIKNQLCLCATANFAQVMEKTVVFAPVHQTTKIFLLLASIYVQGMKSLADQNCV